MAHKSDPLQAHTKLSELSLEALQNRIDVIEAQNLTFVPDDLFLPQRLENHRSRNRERKALILEIERRRAAKGESLRDRLPATPSQGMAEVSDGGPAETAR